MSYLGEDTPKLGFGLMRLPHVDGNPNAPIDVETTKELVDMFLAGGFSYFDTAYGYEGSEVTIKEALVDRYPRESYTLATKLPAWKGADSAEEARQMFYTSLERTGAGYFDFYLLHNINETRIEAFDRFGIWDFVQELKEQGLIKHIGFSFHDHPDFLAKVLTEHPEVEFVQLQINYADWDNPVVESRGNYEVASRFGKPVVIMEPLRGGKLCRLPEAAEKALKKAAPENSIASWGIRFAISLPNVITVLSGMNSVEQMQDNIDTATRYGDGGFSDRELQALAKAHTILNKRPRIGCTDCRYCVKGCPQHIPIPGIFDAYNNYLVYDDLSEARRSYAMATGGDAGKASDCEGCGQCEEVCTQGIPIREKLEEIAAKLES